MHVTFCGGAGEVGASCYLLKLDNKNILLDCGIRMGGKKDILPDFRLIQEQGGVDAIVVSHAHMDHTGSLPIISREYPNAPIYMTHATKDLVRVLLYDSLKIMDSRESEIPVYAEAHVSGMLDRVVCYSPENAFDVLSGIRASLFYAGHVAGSACVYIQGREGTVFYSGDFSLFRQNSIEGASVPRLRPDVALIESTYGDKLHANRELEEQRLVDTVSRIVGQGGKILIPAFALGRAQEIILILRRAINRKTLPQCKIYVDGMVREISRMYRLNPNYLRNQHAKKIWKGQDIFFDDENVIRVQNPAQRQEIIEQKEPCCIISSSGMLTGGPSQWYAEKLASDEKNFIAITGYQDEESPGRQLLNLLEAEEKALNLGERTVPVKCGVGKYGLSAHADRIEILNLVQALQPKKLFLVHGDEAIIMDLAQNLQQEVRGQIHVPRNGETVMLDIRNPRKQLNRRPPISLKKDFLPDEEHLEPLHRHVLETYGMTKAFTAEDLAFIWSGGSDFKEEDIRGLTRLLNESAFFEADNRRPYLFHAVSEEQLEEKQDRGIMEMNQMLAEADRIFPLEARLYKKGARYQESIVVLSFDFPPVAVKKYGHLIKALEEKTGWKVEVNPEYLLEALDSVVYQVLPSEAQIKGKISYYRNEGKVRVSLTDNSEGREGTRESWDMDEIRNRFAEITGLNLELDLGGNLEQMAPVAAKGLQMEQNSAFARIEEEFKDVPDVLYKKSLKRDGASSFIELSFITPQVGERYRKLLDRLEQETWWDIRINPAPNTNEILKLVRRILEERGIHLKKNPGFFERERIVKAVLVSEPDPETIMEIEKKFLGKTGYNIQFEKTRNGNSFLTMDQNTGKI